MNEEYNDQVEKITEDAKEEAAAEIIEASENEEKTEKNPSAAEELKEWVKDILIAIVVAALVLQFIMPTIVREHSMENTLHNDDYVFVSRKAYTWFGEPQRGDIIVFKSNLLLQNGQNKLLVKRIIGIPGDTISISGGIVYLNGEALEENYTKDGYTLGDMSEITVPEYSLFCMGDNRQNSADSRDGRIGCVSMNDVKGKVVFRLLPLSDFGGVYNK